jgi:hypothetical protein
MHRETAPIPQIGSLTGHYDRSDRSHADKADRATIYHIRVNIIASRSNDNLLTSHGREEIGFYRYGFYLLIFISTMPNSLQELAIIHKRHNADMNISRHGRHV